MPQAQNAFVLMEVDKITDVPAPKGGSGAVMLYLERTSKPGSPIGPPAGPIKMEPQGNSELRQALNLDARLSAPVKMEELAKDEMEVRVVACYQGQQQPIGSTDPIKVSWKPNPPYYVAINDQMKKAVGGAYLSHRWVNEADLKRTMTRTNTMMAPRRPRQNPMKSEIIGGTSGRFKPGTQDAINEEAALAVEAQNRALVQRVNRAKQYSTECSPDQNTAAGNMWETPTGYRDWSNLDSVFVTMGPNYVCQSEELGAAVCRVYEEDTSIWKELRNKPGLKPINPRDEILAKSLVTTIYPYNAEEVQKTLRPVICKDVQTLDRDGVRDAKNKPILHVTVRNAVNLRTRAGFLQGEVHPKVIVRVPTKSSASWETSAARDSKHVEWNQSGVVKGWNYGDPLHIMVVDKGFLGFAGETHLGEARLQASDFYPAEWRAALPLEKAGPAGNTGGRSRSPSASPRGRGPVGGFAALNIEVVVEEPLGRSNWPPSPPIYAPMQNLNVSDQETQHLANWDIHQNSKLPFADVNPNYQMNEDIWGANADIKTLQQAKFLEKPESETKRVKDSCLMA
jgi:hypothetical protein